MKRRLVGGSEGGCTARRFNCTGSIPASLPSGRHCPTRLFHPMPQPAALLLQPALEVRRSRDVEACEQVAPIEREGLLQPALVSRPLEFHGVTANPVGRDGQGVVAPRHDRLGAELVAQKIERLTKGVPGLFGGVLGPE